MGCWDRHDFRTKFVCTVSIGIDGSNSSGIEAVVK